MNRFQSAQGNTSQARQAQAEAEAIGRAAGVSYNVTDYDSEVRIKTNAAWIEVRHVVSEICFNLNFRWRVWHSCPSTQRITGDGTRSFFTSNPQSANFCFPRYAITGRLVLNQLVLIPSLPGQRCFLIIESWTSIPSHPVCLIFLGSVFLKINSDHWALVRGQSSMIHNQVIKV